MSSEGVFKSSETNVLAIVSSLNSSIALLVILARLDDIESRGHATR